MPKDLNFKTDVIVYLSLMILLGLTIGLSYVPLGKFNFLVAFLIAAAKAFLVMIYFMQLKRSSKLTWIYASIGLIWLLIATVLTFADYLTRGPVIPPLT